METITLTLLGVILITNGWYWGGVTEGRTTGIATGLAAVILAVAAAFNIPQLAPEVAVLAGLGAVFGGMVALDAYTETTNDRTLGLFSLALVVAAALVLAAILATTGAFTLVALGTVFVATAWLLIFISEGLIPQVEAFRRFAGWTTLILGAAVLFIGFSPLLNLELAA